MRNGENCQHCVRDFSRRVIYLPILTLAKGASLSSRRKTRAIDLWQCLAKDVPPRHVVQGKRRVKKWARQPIWPTMCDLRLGCNTNHLCHMSIYANVCQIEILL